MRVTNKRRFTAFIVAMMILSGVGGFYIGISYADVEEPEVAEETPVVVEETVEVEEVSEPEPVATIEFVDIGTYTITAYCGCEVCCGQWASDPVIGSGGIELIEGVHCASPLPLGTLVEIDGVGVLEVQDRTADWIADKYNDRVIDVYFADHRDALEFGKRTANVRKVVEVM